MLLNFQSSKVSTKKPSKKGSRYAMPKARARKVINSRIVQLDDVEKMHQQNFDSLADNICEIQNQKHKLEQFIYRFKNGNKKYLKVKSIAEEIVNRLLIEQESFLDLALKAVIEALRVTIANMTTMTIFLRAVVPLRLQ